MNIYQIWKGLAYNSKVSKRVHGKIFWTKYRGKRLNFGFKSFNDVTLFLENKYSSSSFWIVDIVGALKPNALNGHLWNEHLVHLVEIHFPQESATAQCQVNMKEPREDFNFNQGLWSVVSWMQSHLKVHHSTNLFFWTKRDRKDLDQEVLGQADFWHLLSQNNHGSGWWMLRLGTFNFSSFGSAVYSTWKVDNLKNWHWWCFGVACSPGVNIAEDCLAAFSPAWC